MTHFKLTDFSVKAEPVKTERITISELDSDVDLHVDQFTVSSFKKAGNNYPQVKEKFGPLAVTDPGRADRSQKDRRFSLNPLLRDPLSVEQEEQRSIDERVKLLVDDLAVAAKKEAELAGYQDGLKRGSEEALSRVQVEADASLVKFQTLVSELETVRVDVFRENEKFLIGLIFRIAKMVTLKELTTDREYLLRLTKELVENAGVQDNTILKINSEDEQFITSIKENLFKTFGDMRNLNIEVSSKVSRGGCRIETEWNAIDVNVEEQFKRIQEALLGKTSGAQ
jgi:flagellar biosynthesis/type III secretory pathway protein FliH